jgi:hypothetical protein
MTAKYVFRSVNLNAAGSAKKRVLGKTYVSASFVSNVSDKYFASYG